MGLIWRNYAQIKYTWIYQNRLNHLIHRHICYLLFFKWITWFTAYSQ